MIDASSERVTPAALAARRSTTMHRTTSTRLTIAQQALDDARARLDELPDVPAVHALRERLRACAAMLHMYAIDDPATEHRAELLEHVLELHVAVSRLARELGA